MAAFLAALPAIIQGANQTNQMIYRGIVSWNQNRLAKKLERENPRPDYEIPQSMKDSLRNAQTMASGFDMPGQDIMESQLRGSTSRGVNAMSQNAGSSAAVLGNISNLYGNEMQGVNNLNLAAAQNYQQRQAALRNELKNMAGQESNQWQWDKADPYMSAMKASSALRGASMQNLAGAMNQGSDAANSASMYTYAANQNGDFGGGTKSSYIPSSENSTGLSNSYYQTAETTPNSDQLFAQLWKYGNFKMGKPS